MDSHLDYANIYKAINTKLKKRTFKKPSVIEAGDDFASMSKNLAAEDTPEYAAIFVLGKARCEASSNNVIGEATSLLTASSHFIQAERKLRSISAVTFGENLDCATMCLLRAAKLYETNEYMALATNTYIYLGDVLMSFSNYTDAIAHLRHASGLISHDVLRCLKVLSKLSLCLIETHDYVGALNMFIRMQYLIRHTYLSRGNNASFGIYADYLTEAEVYRVILLLLISPPDKICSAVDSGYSLKRYLLDASEQAVGDHTLGFPHMNENLFLCLQSFVMAHSAADLVDAECMATELQRFLTTQQRDLLMLVLREMVTPSVCVV